MNTLHTLLDIIWVSGAFILAIYLLLWLFMGMAVLRITFSPQSQWKKWTVDPNDPEAEASKKGIMREVEPGDFVILTRAGAFVTPIVQWGALQLTVKGLQDEYPGIRSTCEEDWEVQQHTNQTKYRNTIQGQYGFLDPYFVFRRLVHWITRRHVVRIWFPFFLSGFWEIYKPRVVSFYRGRPKGRSKTSHQIVIGESPPNAEVEMVRDMSDHVPWRFPLRILTKGFPTQDGFSLRADITLTFELKNVLMYFWYKDATEQLTTVASDSVSQYFRSGNLDGVYATKGDSNNRVLQNLIFRHLTDARMHHLGYATREITTRVGGRVKIIEKSKPLPTSVALGLELQMVTVNDMLADDKETETAIQKLMAIVPTGRNNATASQAHLQAKVDVLTGVDEETIGSMAAITAAENLAKAQKVDYFIGNQAATTEQGLLNKIAKNVNRSKETSDPLEEGGEK